MLLPKFCWITYKYSQKDKKGIYLNSKSLNMLNLGLR
jgi:hypothetical protein